MQVNHLMMVTRVALIFHPTPMSLRSLKLKPNSFLEALTISLVELGLDLLFKWKCGIVTIRTSADILLGSVLCHVVKLINVF